MKYHRNALPEESPVRQATLSVKLGNQSLRLWTAGPNEVRLFLSSDEIRFVSWSELQTLCQKLQKWLEFLGE